MSLVGKRILLVEDEITLGETLFERLTKENADVHWTKTSSDSKQSLLEFHYDIILLDVGLPDENGYELAMWIKEQSIQTPLVFVTAFDEPEQRVHGLELGAKDYLSKPFQIKELLIRIQNILSPQAFNQSIQIGDLIIDFEQFLIKRNKKNHTLTPKESEILRFLFLNRNRVVSREEMLNTIWKDDQLESNRTIDNFIGRLRKYIEKEPNQPEILVSIRGVGYQFRIKEKS
ncbi:MAG: DNA-binding response regulator [Bdellovibrionaceae bacterium]|nr:DNA-binding response regulator [Pseudobdellovibrionaceae bacterium]|tara:strand:- start:1235 stop:1927 length:693 start_codon:yes stop_codon:yes gene_type:complete